MLPLYGRADQRLWVPTERPDEWLTLSAPLGGVHVLSVIDSDRPWAQHHETQTLCLIHASQEGVGARWRSGRSTFFTGAGEIMVMDPGSCHKTLRVYGGKGSFSVVQVEPGVLAQMACEMDLRSSPFVCAGNMPDPPLASAIGRFVAGVAANAERLELECRLVDLVRAMWRNRAGPRPVRDPVVHRGVRRARDAIRDLCASPYKIGDLPRLADLALISGLSASRFPHAFTEWLGISPHAYLNLCRLEAARRMLERGQPATEVAAAVAFTDLPALSRMFRRHYGLSPRKWREQLRGRTVPATGPA